jgi:hypothetical protein
MTIICSPHPSIHAYSMICWGMSRDYAVIIGGGVRVCPAFTLQAL